jgi:hypothetical protein
VTTVRGEYKVPGGKLVAAEVSEDEGRLASVPMTPWNASRGP